MSDVAIRRADSNDIGGVAPLVDAYRQFYEQGPRLEQARQFMVERFERKDSIVFVACAGAELVGFTQLFLTYSTVRLSRVWHINDLYVDPRFRGGGVGRAMMERAIAFAREDGAVRVTLETARDNTTAQRLYERLGFVKGEKFWKYTLPIETSA